MKMLDVQKVGLPLAGGAASRGGVILALGRVWDGSATHWRQAKQTHSQAARAQEDPATQKQKATEEEKVR